MKMLEADLSSGTVFAKTGMVLKMGAHNPSPSSPLLVLMEKSSF